MDCTLFVFTALLSRKVNVKSVFLLPECEKVFSKIGLGIHTGNRIEILWLIQTFKDGSFIYLQHLFKENPLLHFWLFISYKKREDEEVELRAMRILMIPGGPGPGKGLGRGRGRGRGRGPGKGPGQYYPLETNISLRTHNILRSNYDPDKKKKKNEKNFSLIERVSFLRDKKAHHKRSCCCFRPS